ncbi:MAG: DUF4167 domain-containing protein, partial [Rhodospirillaceae bacterium]|nr:DUF4167 domain-containing protein [Rhodospirillaceae bacterium]
MYASKRNTEKYVNFTTTTKDIMSKNQNQNKNRSRGRNNNRRGGQSRGNNFESNGPEVKVRGTAQQVLDKYLQLARDAQSSGDRINAEGYLQYAEHYYRIINADSNLSANNGSNAATGSASVNGDTSHRSGGNGSNGESASEQVSASEAVE